MPNEAITEKLSEMVKAFIMWWHFTAFVQQQFWFLQNSENTEICTNKKIILLMV